MSSARREVCAGCGHPQGSARCNAARSAGTCSYFDGRITESYEKATREDLQAAAESAGVQYREDGPEGDGYTCTVGQVEHAHLLAAELHSEGWEVIVAPWSWGVEVYFARELPADAVADAPHSTATQYRRSNQSAGAA